MLRAALPFACLALVAHLGLPLPPTSDDDPLYPDMPAGAPPRTENPEAEADTEAEMRPYEERITGTEVSFRLTPVPGGSFLLGSPEDEDGRGAGEDPQVQVSISPFWMGVHEVTWDEYQLYMAKLDLRMRERGDVEPAPQDAWADAVSRPTPPYSPMDFEMGVDGYPAICMTQFAAKQYTKWLSMKTGRFYRLPTEAEWEYACRAGTATAYWFGDDPDELEDHDWYFDNAADTYWPVGARPANPWGLVDMHGNVSEWVLDAYDKGWYAQLAELPQPVADPVNWPTELYPRVVRGGSWDYDPEDCRSASRRGSTVSWMVRDPQLPKSIWFLTDARTVGFRVVRPLVEPTDEDRARFWEADLDGIRAIQEKQRRGER